VPKEIIAGIYKFTSKINGLSYIGQSVDIETRRKRHIRIAKAENFPKNEDSYFHRALKKYGDTSFTFEILEAFSVMDIQENRNILNDAEKKWIMIFNTLSPNGYNGKSGGGQGVHYSVSSRDKMSLIQKAIQAEKATKPTKPIICLETKIEYKSAKEASISTGLNPLSISACCRGESLSSGGFHWSYLDNYKENLLETIVKLKNKRQEKPSKAIICIETGQIFRSPFQAIKAMGLKKGIHILECCKGLRPTAGGYHWQFVKNWQEGKNNIKTQEKQKRPVVCIETGIVYPSALHAKKSTGIQNAAIGKCCQGKQKQAGGYHWSYA